MVAADGLRLMYFHLASQGIRVLLSLTVFLILDWNIFVGLVELVGKALVCMKSCILESYCWVGRMTMALPLSTFVIIALFCWSLVFIAFIVMLSGCVLLLGRELFCCSVPMRSAASFLYTSRSAVGSLEIAVSASRARV